MRKQSLGSLSLFSLCKFVIRMASRLRVPFLLWQRCIAMVEGIFRTHVSYPNILRCACPDSQVFPTPGGFLCLSLSPLTRQVASLTSSSPGRLHWPRPCCATCKEMRLSVDEFVAKFDEQLGEEMDVAWPHLICRPFVPVMPRWYLVFHLWGKLHVHLSQIPHGCTSHLCGHASGLPI